MQERTAFPTSIALPTVWLPLPLPAIQMYCPGNALSLLTLYFLGDSLCTPLLHRSSTHFSDEWGRSLLWADLCTRSLQPHDQSPPRARSALPLIQVVEREAGKCVQSGGAAVRGIMTIPAEACGTEVVLYYRLITDSIQAKNQRGAAQALLCLHSIPTVSGGKLEVTPMSFGGAIRNPTTRRMTNKWVLRRIGLCHKHSQKQPNVASHLQSHNCIDIMMPIVHCVWRPFTVHLKDSFFSFFFLWLVLRGRRLCTPPMDGPPLTPTPHPQLAYILKSVQTNGSYAYGIPCIYPPDSWPSPLHLSQNIMDNQSVSSVFRL